MKIALAQLNFHTGNFEQNTDKIIRNIRSAKEQGADVVVLPELAITGYPPRDFLEFEHFLELCQQSIDKIAAACTDVGAIVGCPSINPRMEGKNLFNSAYFLAEGKVQQVYSKTLLPTYDVFDEYRYFEPASEHKCIRYRGYTIALTICEDIWDLQDDPLYNIKPMETLMQEEPDVMINIAASPFSWRHDKRRKETLRKNVEHYKLPMFYVNHVGAQTELIFDGNSTVVKPDGQVYDVLDCFSEDLRVYDLEEVKQQKPQVSEPRPSKMQLIHDALVLGIRDYFSKLGFKKAILGLSGGIDSAVVQVLGAHALGAENVLGVMMPTKYTSDLSRTDAAKLVENLGSPYKVISIQDPYQSMLGLMQPHFEGKAFNVAEENMQARTRMLILMALSNKLGYILLNTSNKSELAVGYGTLYGDMAGGISVLGDVYKTELFELAEWLNRNGEVIPKSIITRPPSAELRPDQKDTDSLPPYEELDAILHGYIEERLGPRELIERGHEEQLVGRVLKMVNQNEYKRHQFPPILRISDKAFGMGRRMPIVAKYLG